MATLQKFSSSLIIYFGALHLNYIRPINLGPLIVKKVKLQEVNNAASNLRAKREISELANSRLRCP